MRARLKVKVAEHGEPLRDGVVYIAADNHHLTIARDRTIALSDEPLVAGHRPSATMLFKSAAKTYGAGVLAIILTGMGKDGVDGLGGDTEAPAAPLSRKTRKAARFLVCQKPQSTPDAPTRLFLSMGSSHAFGQRVVQTEFIGGNHGTITCG